MVATDNFEHHDPCENNEIRKLLGVSAALLALAFVAVCLRMYVRTVMVRWVGADDWAILAGMAMAIATSICFVGEVKSAISHYAECIVSPEPLLRWLYFHLIWTMLGAAMVKTSVTLVLLRLASQRWCKWVLGCSISLVILATLTSCGVLMFSCTPIAAFWDLSLQAQASCLPTETVAGIGLFHTITIICVDLLFAMMPIPIVRQLEISRRRKLTLILFLGLSLGFLCCIAAFVKLYWQLTSLHERDRYWEGSLWNLIELCLAIFGASLPAIRPLMIRIGSRSAFRLPPSRIAHTRGSRLLSKIGHRPRNEPYLSSENIEGRPRTVHLQDFKQLQMVRTPQKSGKAQAYERPRTANGREDGDRRNEDGTGDSSHKQRLEIYKRWEICIEDDQGNTTTF